MSNPNKIVKSTRKIIEGKVMAILNDKSKVALIVDEDDLDLIIYSLGLNKSAHAPAMKESLLQLKKAAFLR